MSKNSENGVWVFVHFLCVFWMIKVKEKNLKRQKKNLMFWFAHD